VDRSALMLERAQAALPERMARDLSARRR
jgi:hypothetical protein